MSTCYSKDGIIWALPPRKLRDDVIATQCLHLLRPRDARKHAVGPIQQFAQLTLGYGPWVVVYVIHYIQHLHAPQLQPVVQNWVGSVQISCYLCL